MRLQVILRRAALDVALWVFAPVLFLFFYSRVSNITLGTAFAHLRLVLVAWLCIALLRLAFSRLIPAPRIARALSALVVASAIMIMAVYYCAVLIGLSSWGRVISWDLIRSYAVQAPALIDALGLSVWMVAGSLTVLYAVVFALAWSLAGRLGWIGRTSRLARPRIVVLVFVAGVGVCAAELYGYTAFPPVREREPVSLTFYPFQAATVLQNAAIDPLRAERLDALEDAARERYSPNPTARRRNVVLIVVDALRPDRMGVYGYSRKTTPHLDRMAAAGMIRKPGQMRSACSASVCGLVSLLTSKFVHQFSERPFSLHEVLELHGYRSQMILGGDHRNFYGLKELYGGIDDYYDGSMSRNKYGNDDRLVLERAARMPAWDGAPAIIQFHLMSTHILGLRHEEYARYAPAASYAIPMNRRAPLVDNFYDNGVAQADAIIHELLTILRGKGYLQEALVVITADHGESLGEGGRYSHAQNVAEEALRIPLLLMAYGYEPDLALSEGVVGSQVDVAPTVLAELGMPRPETWSGVPLQAPIRRPYTYFQEGYAAGLIDHRDPRRLWKYWVDTRKAREYAHDLAADPHTLINAIDTVAQDLKRAWRLEYLRFQPGGTGVERIFMR